MRLSKYPSDIADWLSLPASGYPLTFKEFVIDYKNKDIITVNLDNQPTVRDFCRIVENNLNYTEFSIIDFDYLELEIYFLYLSSLYFKKDEKLKLHGQWISRSMTFEELCFLADRGLDIEITFNEIIYNSLKGKVFIKFFY